MYNLYLVLYNVLQPNTMKVDENKWTIVADTTSLLNKKSRKELQLLRGLRGTTLVIPRIGNEPPTYDISLCIYIIYI